MTINRPQNSLAEYQGRLSSHSLHNSSPCFSACFLDLNVRAVDSIRLILLSDSGRDQKPAPVSTIDSRVLEPPLHKSDGLCIDSWPGPSDRWRTYNSTQCTESRPVRENLMTAHIEIHERRERQDRARYLATPA